MAQNYKINSYQSSHIGNTDLQNMENNFECLRSMMSGSDAPANAIPGMPWFDTTNKLLKIRNSLNSKWLGVMYGNSNTKLWVYANSAGDGWILDPSPPTDVVLVLKGGSTYTTGGSVAGTWTMPGCTLSLSQIPAHDHGASSDHTHTMDCYYNVGSGQTTSRGFNSYSQGGYHITDSQGNHTHNAYGKSSNDAHSHGGTTYRLKAAVGTLQYPNL